MSKQTVQTVDIPEIINNFNVYKGGNQLIGVSGEVALPDMNAITEEISGAGILGTYKTSVLGQYESMEQEIPFRVLDDDIFSLMDPTEQLDLTFRASNQSTVRSTGEIKYKGMRIVERGKMMGFTPGTLVLGKQMNAKVKLEIIYLMVEIDGKKKFELDKLNNVFNVNGKDVLEKVREQC